MARMLALAARADMRPLAVLALLAVIVLEADLLAVVSVPEAPLMKNFAFTACLAAATSTATTFALREASMVGSEALLVELELAHGLLQGSVRELLGGRQVQGWRR